MRLRWKVGIVAGIAILGMAGSALYSLTKDTTWLKTRISSAVEQQTGRKLTIGTLRVWFLPFPWVQAKDIHFSGLEGEQHDMASMRQLRVRLALRPLLSHHVVLRDITLIDPDIYLLRLRDGRANWQMGTKKVAANSHRTPQKSSGKSAWNISVPNLTIHNAAIHWQDDVSHNKGEVQFQKIALHDLDKRQPDISVQGKYGPGDFLLSGHIGQVWPMQKKFPLDLTLSLSQQEAVLASAQVQGAVFALQQNPDYVLSIATNIEQLAALNAFAPHLKLPKSERITLNTNVAGRGGNPVVQDLHLHTGSIDLTQWMADSSIGKITIDGNTLQAPLAIHADGHFNQQRVQADGNVGTLQILTHDMLRNDVPVNLAVREGETAVQLHGVLGPNRAHFDVDGSLASLPLKADNSSINGLQVTAHAETDRVAMLKTQHQLVDILRALRASGKAHIQNVNWQGAVWNNVQAEFRDLDGRVDVNPVTAEGGGQQQNARLSYDVTGEQPHLGFAAHPLYVPLEAIRNTMHITPQLSGSAQIVGEGTSAGTTSTQITDNLNGHLGVSIVNGSVDRDFLVRFLNLKLPFSPTLPVSCMAVHTKIDNGSSTVDDLGMQALILRLKGQGRVGVTSHDMDMILNSQLLLGRNTPSSQVHISGPWEAPHADVLQANIQGTNTQPQSSKQFCTTLLKAAREGEPGPAPDLSQTNMRGEVTNLIAKKLGVKSKDVQKGEKLLNQGLGIARNAKDGKPLTLPKVGNGQAPANIPSIPQNSKIGKDLSQFGF